MFYLIFLILALSIYIIGVFFLKTPPNIKLVNAVCVISTFILYLALVVYVYFDAGIDDWNFKNVLPTANVSPFIFCLAPLVLIMPSKLKPLFKTLISLLSVGMLLSAVFGCIFNAYRNYAFHIHFLFDYVAHLIISFWGVYLVKSKQVKLNLKSILFGGAIIVTVALIMLFINLVFDTAFFGLNLNGKHNIYNVVLTSSSILNAILYFIGLTAVLWLGALYCK
ncbi:MAG: hypothetical protein J6R88_03090, partial [Clostridia bacterium]|nr:hypothetical protein [Clostridia bacterium]